MRRGALRKRVLDRRFRHAYHPETGREMPEAIIETTLEAQDVWTSPWVWGRRTTRGTFSNPEGDRAVGVWDGRQWVWTSL